MGLSHVDAGGRARMVDVTAKEWTRRQAVARCRVSVDRATRPTAETAATRPSVDLLEQARLAGIQAAKQTSRLVPLCHPLSGVEVHVTCSLAQGGVEIESRADVVAPTGVEMEALTACAVAALTIVAGLGPQEPGVCVEDLALWAKSGGRSGTWNRR